MTRQLYLTDMHQLSCDASVVRSGEHEDGRRYVVVDQSPFHPQGGGQPADRGVIVSDDGLRVEVTDVRHGPDGEVWHFAELDGEPGDAVKLEVDPELRALLSRLHSGGHVIDMAVSALGWGWKPGKGFHFPEGAYVEYSGELEIAGDDRVERLENQAADLVASNLSVSVATEDREDLAKDPRVDIETIPGEGPVRVVSYGQTRIPCGGTHVRSLLDVGRVTVRKIKAKKGVIRVGYDVERGEVRT